MDFRREKQKKKQFTEKHFASRSRIVDQTKEDKREVKTIRNYFYYSKIQGHEARQSKYFVLDIIQIKD